MILNNIKKLREDKGMSQEELAHEAGVSTSTIQKMEAGPPKTEGSHPNRANIAKALGVTVSSVFFFSDDNQQNLV